MIFAHRGASGNAPENTMAAFRLAVEQGCEAIELDVQLTKDGEVVICHDHVLNRTTNGSGLLKDYTLSELQQFDAGGWFAETFAGEPIPSLDEFLAFIAKTNVTVNIELKNLPIAYEEIERKVVELVYKHGMAEKVIISSFDHYSLANVAKLDSSLKLGVLFATKLIEPWKYVAQLPFAAYSIHPHYSFVDEGYINECHNRGYKVIAYTVDDTDWYQHYRRLGIDGIFSNYPERFLADGNAGL
jgi:glycerophosphoryl diester phosphodiesterase